MLYDKEFDTKLDAQFYIKEIEGCDWGKYKCVLLEEDGKWVVEVWYSDDY